MQVAMVEGLAVATIKHPSMKGWRLLLVQPLDAAGGPDGEPQLVVDSLGATRGCRVLITSDGRGAREMVGDSATPVRWHVIGILDES